ncbi:hypothetical protein [Geodermatophilus sp. SYSU D00766]
MAGGLLDAAPAVRAAESRGQTVGRLLDRDLAELLHELQVANANRICTPVDVPAARRRAVHPNGVSRIPRGRPRVPV